MTKKDDDTRVYVNTRAKKFEEILNQRKNDFLSASDDIPVVDSEGNPIVLTQEQENQIFMDVTQEDLYDEARRSHRYMYGTTKNKERGSLRSDASTACGRARHEMQLEITKLIEEAVVLRQEVAQLVEKEGELKDMIVTLHQSLAEMDVARDASHTKFQKMIMSQIANVRNPTSN